MTPSAAATSPGTGRWELQDAFHDIQNAISEGLVCTYCKACHHNLAACSCCLSTFYCGKDCQQAHWLATHQRECSAMAHHGFQNFVRAMEEQQEQQREHNQMHACPPSAAGDTTRKWEHHCSTKVDTQAVDAWLQEMGRVAFATASPSSPWSFRHSSSPAEAAAESYPPLPGPGLKGLKTLCILAKGSIPFLQKQEQQQQLSLASIPSSSPPSSPSSSTTTDSVATRMYLKTLAVHGQLSLRPGNLRSKQETAVKKIIDALNKHQEAALLVPDWTAHLLLVAGRLLCSLGRRSNAVALLQKHLPLLEPSSMAAPRAVAYLWLQYTQWAYYDQGAWMDKTPEEQREAAAKVEAACRRALILLQEAGVMAGFPPSPSFPSPPCSSSMPSYSPRNSLYIEALVATASFRLADLLLERGEAADALELCRISLHCAAPIHFPTLAVYLAAALQALGQGGKTEAAIEVRMEKKLRRFMAEEALRRGPSSSPPLLSLPRSASLLNMHGLEDMWSLSAEPWLLIRHHNLHHHLPPVHRRFQKHHRQQQQEWQEQQQQQEQEQEYNRFNIPRTERRRDTRAKMETVAMDVCGEYALEREGRKETHEIIPPSIGTAHPRPTTASSSLVSDGSNKNVFAADVPPQKRRRSQRYPNFDQLASCVALPWWAVSAHG